MMVVPANAKYQIVNEMAQRENNMLNVTWLCDAAGVSRSGYYHYLSTEDIRLKREEQDRQDFLIIIEAYQFRGYNKGARGYLYETSSQKSISAYEYKENTTFNEEIWAVLPNTQGQSLSTYGKSYGFSLCCAKSIEPRVRNTRAT